MSTGVAAMNPCIGGLITVRLSRTNFLLWKAQVVLVLSGQNLFGYLDGSFPEPPRTRTEGADAAAKQVDNPVYPRWKQQDQLILGMLLSSMTEEILGQMISLTTSASVWRSLHAMFSPQNTANIIKVRHQLSTLKNKDMTISKYFLEMKTYADTMATNGSAST
ncbi:unnamed protein product [Urochloa humidicola]